MRLVFNVELLKIGGVNNAHELALKCGVSYPVAHRYVTKPESIKLFDARVLPSIMMAAGLDLEQLGNMRVKDLFRIIED